MVVKKPCVKDVNPNPVVEEVGEVEEEEEAERVRVSVSVVVERVKSPVGPAPITTISVSIILR